MDWETYPISVSISSNLIQEPIFLCNPNPCDSVSSFIDALENVATQSKAQMKLNFFTLKPQQKIDCRYPRTNKSTS